MENIEEHANLIYSTYCEAVGGIAFNGDPLPAWSDFAADPNKQRQADAWRAAAKESLQSQSDAQRLADDLWEMLKESWTAMRSAWNRMDTIREQAPEIYLESDMANLAAPLPHLRNPYTDTDIDEAVVKFRSQNASILP